MKLIKTHPRYRCDYCKFKGTKYRMEWHEKVCYYNLNRVCTICNNKGKVVVYSDGEQTYYQDCSACKIALGLREKLTKLALIQLKQ